MRYNNNNKIILEHSQAMEAAKGLALAFAKANFSGNFIACDSLHGNLIIPAVPSFPWMDKLVRPDSLASTQVMHSKGSCESLSQEYTASH